MSIILTGYEVFTKMLKTFVSIEKCLKFSNFKSTRFLPYYLKVTENYRKLKPLYPIDLKFFQVYLYAYTHINLGGEIKHIIIY